MRLNDNLDIRFRKKGQLQGLTADEARQVAQDSHRVAHQQALERREAVDSSKAETAGEPDRGDRVREQAVEPVGHSGEHQCVETAPPLVAGEQDVVANVEAEPSSINHQLGQGGYVADSEVEALTGDWVDYVGRLADEREPASDIALRQHQPEGIGPARADYLNRAKKISEAGGELRREGYIGEPNQPHGKFALFGPNDRGTVVVHRQDRKWPRREEVLDRNAAVWAFVMHCRHDTGLAVRPFDGADACSPAHRRLLTIGCSHEAGPEPSPVAKGRDRGKNRGFDGADGERSEEPQARKRSGTLDKCTAKHPIFHDITERRSSLEMLMVVVQKQRRFIVGDPNLGDRLGPRADLRPEAESVQDPARPVGNRRTTAVETFIRYGCGIGGIDDRDLDPGAGASGRK